MAKRIPRIPKPTAIPTAVELTLLPGDAEATRPRVNQLSKSDKYVKEIPKGFEFLMTTTTISIQPSARLPGPHQVHGSPRSVRVRPRNEF